MFRCVAGSLEVQSAFGRGQGIAVSGTEEPLLYRHGCVIVDISSDLL